MAKQSCLTHEIGKRLDCLLGIRRILDVIISHTSELLNLFWNRLPWIHVSTERSSHLHSHPAQFDSRDLSNLFLLGSQAGRLEVEHNELLHSQQRVKKRSVRLIERFH